MIENKEFENSLLTKIKKEHLNPMPKWKFVFKNISWWLGGGLFLIFGGLAVSLIIFLFSDEGLNIFLRTKGFGWEIFLFSIPVFWLLLFIFFSWLVYANFKETKQGYRYSFFLISLGSLLISLLLGLTFHFCGIDEQIDDLLGRRAPFYGEVLNPSVKFWSEPEQGRLSGVVATSTNEGDYLIIDRDGKEWTVLTKAPCGCLHKITIPAGAPVKFIGRKLNNNNFELEKIIPMRPGKAFYGKIKILPPPPERVKAMMHCGEVAPMPESLCH
ncbi:MAG: hypothetical protein PHR00_03985 [Patescibacteria group bacterium]|nr:hypothetical protein [Patescibacteria group bacterium]